MVKMATDLTPGLFKLRFQALGTACEIQFRAPAVKEARAFKTAALTWIQKFEATWSRYRADSFLSQVNAGAGRRSFELTPEQDEIVALCQYSYQFTQGLIDASACPLTLLWEEAERRGVRPSTREVEDVLKLVSWEAVDYRPGHLFLPQEGMAIEIGGFGKEYAVDRLRTIAVEFGVEAALVDLGRDVATLGSPPQGDYWVVGIENAGELDAPVHRVALSGQAVATSGNGRRYRSIGGERFGHILDIRSGEPAVNEVLTASGLANDCLTAGLLATSACIRGISEGLAEIERHHQVEGVLQSRSDLYFSQNMHRYLISS